jgi:hypothetical protein
VTKGVTCDARLRRRDSGVIHIPMCSQSQPASSIFLHSSDSLDRSDYLGQPSDTARESSPKLTARTEGEIMH